MIYNTRRNHTAAENGNYFQIANEVSLVESPYRKAKIAQLYEKDVDKAIELCLDAIRIGDRVDSALKDMATMMRKQNRVGEAIEAIKSWRHICSYKSQEGLDNILLDLYKKCGRWDDLISLLRQKLQLIQKGLAFDGKRTKTARFEGRKFQVTIRQEESRLLGNLGWVLLLNGKYKEAEEAYRNALRIQIDNNKMCNLGICLMKQGRTMEARIILMQVQAPATTSSDVQHSHLKAYIRAQETLRDLESKLRCYIIDARVIVIYLLHVNEFSLNH